MKILHVIADLAPRHGGPTKLAPELCRALARRGHEVALYATDYNGDGVQSVPLMTPLMQDGFTLRYFPVGFPRVWRYSQPLGQALRRDIPRFDVVHIHNIYLYHTLAASRACWQSDVPYVISLHGSLDPVIRNRRRLKKGVYTFLFDRRTLERAAALVYTSQIELELAHPYLRIKTPAAVAPLGLELAEYARLPAPGGFRARYPALKDKFFILFMSRINFKKGLDLLAHGFGRLARKFPQAHLVIAGPDNEGYGVKVKQWLADEGVLDRVTFTGMIMGEEKLAALRDADVFVLPSYSENFGIVVVEALACGLPVVISDQVNIHAEISAAGAGRVIQCDAGQVADALEAVLHDPEAASHMGQRGKELVAARYQWDAVAQEFEALYAIVGGPGPAHAGSSAKTPVSVLVCTKNEERNLPACLEALKFADEVVVLDSFSDDGTVALAQALGAKVVQREFDNFSAQKNWALDNLDFRHPWVLIVDADERITPKLAREIAAAIRQPGDKAGYYVARKNFFAGVWIRHGGWYPDWNLRLLRRGRGHYEARLVHEHPLLDGPAGYLENPLIHYDYKGIERYFDRHNTYSGMEAVEAWRTMTRDRQQGLLQGAYRAQGPERRRFLKNLAYRYLPARPLFKFIWMYFIKLGFLDGRMGLRYCLLHTFYEYQISLKLEELKDPESPLAQKYRNYL
jgi:glycosyltransferase involved in cell wall biosynthesis